MARRTSTWLVVLGEEDVPPRPGARPCHRATPAPRADKAVDQQQQTAAGFEAAALYRRACGFCFQRIGLSRPLTPVPPGPARLPFGCGPITPRFAFRRG
eukprot:scaffold133071_cov72-Phaeocystis_antarctica.AAC.2